MEISGLSNEEFALMREREMKAYDDRCAQEKKIREIKAKALEVAKDNDVLLRSFIDENKKKQPKDLAAKIKKAKKKLKKLQKRQRKQDKLGVISAESYIAESNELIEKVGQVMLDGVKYIYGNPCVIKPV
jgi:Zn-dependent M32 family carboxypeptidase